MNGDRSWAKKIIHWEDVDNHYYSIVFTWSLWEWLQSAQSEMDGRKTVIGGPAVNLHPEWVPPWITIGKIKSALFRHNFLATRTSIGCINKCAFCAIPTTEGSLVELKKWEVKPIIIDNNLLACSRKHFDSVIDKLKKLEWCDFNQGLDVRLLNKYHADRMAELKQPIIRLSFDHTRLEVDFFRAFQLLRKAGIAKDRIRVYVLIGFDDTPQDALYRLQLIRFLGVKSSPMRYQPLDTKTKNEYVSTGWTQKELIRYMTYWANFRYTGHIPFEDYFPHKRVLKKEKLLSCST